MIKRRSREKGTGSYEFHVDNRYGYRPFLIMNLGFFADNDAGEKTEQPTQRKKKKAREEGQVAKSAEIGTAFLFLAVFFSLRVFMPYMFNGLMEIFHYCISLTAKSNEIYNLPYLKEISGYLVIQGALIVLPVFAVAMVIGIAVNVAQVGWHPTTKPLKPKLGKLNPLKGVKRLFSFRIFLELAKSLLKFGAIALTIYNVFNREKGLLFSVFRMDLVSAVILIGNVVIDMAINVGVLYIFIAVADYAYTRFKHTKDLKMTKQEIKEEYKQTEGNPQIKGRIRQKMREASMRRMMQQVPTADVIITNPTHYAVALKYARGMNAPLVVAKGADYLALKIKEIAKQNNVVVVEDKPLARTLYVSVEIGQEVPPELYQAVAEILGYVYKLKNIA